MKLITFLLLAICWQAAARVNAQPVTIQKKDASLLEVLESVREQSGYLFVCDKEMLKDAGRITVDMVDAPLRDVLNACFKDLPLTYTIADKTIVVKRKSGALKAAAPVLQDTLRGIVTDTTGLALPGVTVTVKGRSGAGASTGINGDYALANVPDDALLVFSYLGFQTLEAPVNGRRQLDVALREDLTGLGEVVVVGYGEQQKVNLTGSVATLSFGELENTPQANTLNILSGRMPGLSVIQPGGQPGDDEPEIYVRGVGTLNDASPLVIIDGVLASASDLGNLMPQEIADVSVLKDASSAAIYGARGANGVILVTTKGAEKGKLRINLNAWYGLQQATYLSDFVESWQWMVLHREAVDEGLAYPNSAIEDLQNGIQTDTFSNTRWYDEIFQTAPMANYNLSVAGGTENVSFQGSLGYQQQEGIMLNTNSNRYNFRSNVKANISPKVETGFNLWGYIRDREAPFAGPTGIMDRANKAYPITPVKYSNGMWGVYYPGPGASRTIENPVLFTEIGENTQNDLKANLQTFLQYKPSKVLRLRTSLSYAYFDRKMERFNPTYSYPWIDETPALTNVNNQLINNTNKNKQLQWQTTLTYTKKAGKDHQVALLAGHEYTDYKAASVDTRGFNLPTNDQQVLDRVVNNITVGGNKNEWRLQSFFGRFNYRFKGRYLLEGNLRIDGSSRFPSENKYGYFPSFSAGWILSEETFFRSLVKDDRAVSLLKMRGGIGEVGNDRIGNYTYNQVLNLDSYYNFAGDIQAGGAVTDFANPQIRWESTTTRNLGIDLGFMQNRLNVTFDLYTRITNDILYRLPLAPSFGEVEPAILNIGKVSNKGWDLMVDHKNTAGNFSYNIGFNVSYVKNRVEELNTREAVNSDQFVQILLREGEAINSYYGYVFEGLFRTQGDLDTYPAFSQSGLGLGTMRFKDVNEDGRVTPDDRVVMGHANTPYTFGFTGGLAFKGFDMSFLFQGVQGKSIYIYDFNNRPANGGNINFWKEWWDNRFDPENNPEGTWPSLRRQAPDARESSSFWLQDASYIRLKNVELGYTLPAEFLRRYKISNARLYVSGQNLFTLSNLIKQIDPERATSATNNQSYPQTKVFTVGINTSF